MSPLRGSGPSHNRGTDDALTSSLNGPEMPTDLRPDRGISQPGSRRIMGWAKELFLFLKEAVNEFLTDNCLHLAASISYYVLFCLFPLTLAAVSILGLLYGGEGVNDKVIQAIGTFLPPVREDFIRGAIDEVSKNWAATSAITVIGLLWGGSAVFSALRKALNAAWGVKTPRPFLVERFVELCMMAGVALLLTISFGLTTAVTVGQTISDEAMGGIFSRAIFWDAVRILLTTGLTFITFLVLYRYIPNTKIEWSDIWGGALLGAVASEGAKHIYVWYATEHSDYQYLYGAISTIVALLVWVYVSAAILLFCAKLTSVYSRRRILAPTKRPWWGKKRRITNRIRLGNPAAPPHDAAGLFGVNRVIEGRFGDMNARERDYPEVPEDSV